MFFALMHGKFQIYTSKNNAERALAHYLIKTCIPHASNLNKTPLMECHQREDYAGTIQLWNNYIETNCRNDLFCKVYLSECQADQVFV